MLNSPRASFDDKKKKKVVIMDESFDPLKCTEDLPSSPSCHMDYGKITQATRWFVLFPDGDHP